MSETFPMDPPPSGVMVSSFNPNQVSFSRSLSRQVQNMGIHRFGFKIKYPPMSRGEFAPISAFIESQRGRSGVFSYVLPIESFTSGLTSSLVKVDGEHTKGSFRLSTIGANSPLMPGDYISFSNHTKIYKVLNSDRDSIEINPPLFKTVNSTTVVNYNKVAFSVALSKDLFEYGINVNNHRTFTLELIEVL